MCGYEIDIQAYHDGELPPAQVPSIEEHLLHCEQCQQFRNELRRATAMVHQSTLPEAPPSVDRLAQAAWRRVQVQDHGVRKLAGWMSAAAAVIIVGALVWHPAPPAPMRPAVDGGIIDAEPVGPSLAEDAAARVRLATWMVEELGSKPVEAPETFRDTLEVPELPSDTQPLGAQP